MKLASILALLLSGALVLAFPGWGLATVLAIFLIFLAMGIARSTAKRLDPFNDVPNAIRILMAAASPLLATVLPQPFGVASALLSFSGALFLNDEYQRRAVDSIRSGRVGGSVALLGIDGSGKSTHAEELEDWFRARGYYCTRVPFHRYLFVERLGRKRRSGTPNGSRAGGNPLRPLLSAVDNFILCFMTSFGRGLEGRVVLYDRYIWSTYVKYAALGYPVRPLRWLYMLPRPRFAVVLDVPVEKSLAVIEVRPDHIRYRREVLGVERQEYLRIARDAGFPLVDATGEPASVEKEIEDRLAGLFPLRGK